MTKVLVIYIYIQFAPAAATRSAYLEFYTEEAQIYDLFQIIKSTRINYNNCMVDPQCNFGKEEVEFCKDNDTIDVFRSFTK